MAPGPSACCPSVTYVEFALAAILVVAYPPRKRCLDVESSGAAERRIDQQAHCLSPVRLRAATDMSRITPAMKQQIARIDAPAAALRALERLFGAIQDHSPLADRIFH